MLHITIPATEQWDEDRQEFIYTNEKNLQLEHSLISISKWESKTCKVFLSKEEKTLDETIEYIRCMTLTQNVEPHTYKLLNDEHFRKINDYIEFPTTATKIFQDNSTNDTNREQMTSELIYYWMISFNIPFECQKWHLNRLLTLIRVCNIKNKPPKKISKKELLSRNARMNEIRRKKLNTKG